MRIRVWHYNWGGESYLYREVDTLTAMNDAFKRSRELLNRGEIKQITTDVIASGNLFVGEDR